VGTGETTLQYDRPRFGLADRSKVPDLARAALEDTRLANLRQRLFGTDTAVASFARRGFAPTLAERQRRLENIGASFVTGYNIAIHSADPLAIKQGAMAHSDELAGFVHEGAAMGFALLDILAPWPSRLFASFIEGLAKPHIYLAYIGAGLALARTSRWLMWRLGPPDPLLRWLMLDGYGFHAGYFHPWGAIDRQHRPIGLRRYSCNAFDQGLGRAIWFAKGADIRVVADTVFGFPEDRRPDLWSGVGFAAAYAGGVESVDLIALSIACGPYRTHLGQGAAIAAKARECAGNPAPHTELACRIFCGAGAADAAAITDQALNDVGPDGRGVAYHAWRTAIGRRIGLDSFESAS
jgi:enediyne biosynthesis protein E3